MKPEDPGRLPGSCSESHQDVFNAPAMSCDLTCEMLSTRGAHQTLEPRMCQRLVMPGGHPNSRLQETLHSAQTTWSDSPGPELPS